LASSDRRDERREPPRLKDGVAARSPSPPSHTVRARLA
jgi:hypothetical protein